MRILKALGLTIIALGFITFVNVGVDYIYSISPIYVIYLIAGVCLTGLFSLAYLTVK